MKVIGITGGVGSGKSTVLSLIKENFNAFVIMADEVGRRLMEPGGAAYTKIVEIFGENVLSLDGSIDRAHLADIVFSHKNKLAVLNSIVHPLVKKVIIEDVAAKRCEEIYDFYFIEAALLIEDHYDVICDELWYIRAEPQVRTKRLMESRGYTEEKIRRLLDNQLREEEFKAHCSRVIENGGPLEDTLMQLKRLMERE